MALVAACGLAIVRVPWRDFRDYLQKPPADIVSDFIARYEPLAEFLPPRGLVGYVSPQDTGEIFVAQYVLSPRLVERTPRAPLVICDNPLEPEGTPEIAAREHWTLVHDFGGGLKLFRTPAE